MGAGRVADQEEARGVRAPFARVAVAVQHRALDLLDHHVEGHAGAEIVVDVGQHRAGFGEGGHSATAPILIRVPLGSWPLRIRSRRFL